MQKVVIASDSFKGSLSSMEVAESVSAGIHEVFPECEVIKISMADGGEGLLSAIAGNIEGEKVSAEVHDPLGRCIQAEYLIHDMDGCRIAIIEMAKASGLTLLNADERNPLRASSYGTGEMIIDAFRRGCRRFIIGLGGSAVNDGGGGMLEAMGFRFYNYDGNILTDIKGSNLKCIYEIDTELADQEMLDSEFIAACDVEATFTGPDGASYVFSAQKGADPEMTEELERGMKTFGDAIDRKYGCRISEIKGSGAAGGLGGALHACLGAELKKGSELVLDTIGFDGLIQDADIVITGEGKIDSQTFMGKAPAGVAARAARYGIPTIAIGGIVEIENPVSSTFHAVLSIGKKPENKEELETAMRPDIAKNRIKNTISKYFSINYAKKS